ncbi:MAG: PD-(D/E)XK motif protein [Sporomusaceae bacterium]|nr:PD-(D/E)XK motif protein [Sporomusaceae bacterium]
MNYTSDIYAEILKVAKENEQGKSRSARRLKMENGAVVIFAVDKRNFSLELYVQIENSPDKITFPHWKGIEIGIATLPEYGNNLGKCIFLKQSEQSEDYIFKIIVEDLRVSIEHLRNLKSIVECFSSVLTKWRNFFLIEKDIQLSKERELGLLGELSLLKQLISVYGEAAVSFWSGCNDETHDFYIKGSAIEVKATAQKAPYKANISSEYQLDTQDVLNDLYLQFYVFRKSESDGFTLPKMVHDIELLLVSDTTYLQQFYKKLERYGYLSACAELYQTGYFVREDGLYKVGTDFPRIERSKLETGLSNITYSIIIDMCQKFLISEGIQVLLKGDESNVVG